jgi:hypothetical protein
MIFFLKSAPKVTDTALDVLKSNSFIASNAFGILFLVPLYRNVLLLLQDWSKNTFGVETKNYRYINITENIDIFFLHINELLLSINLSSINIF